MTITRSGKDGRKLMTALLKSCLVMTTAVAVCLCAHDFSFAAGVIEP